MILILGSPDDPHVRLIRDKIQERSEPAICFDTRLFPRETKLNFYPKDLGLSDLHIGTERIAFSMIRSVYWRTFMGMKTKDYEDAHLKEMATREVDSAIGNLVRGLDCPCVTGYEKARSDGDTRTGADSDTTKGLKRPFAVLGEGVTVRTVARRRWFA
jgi:hypothetical protein